MILYNKAINNLKWAITWFFFSLFSLQVFLFITIISIAFYQTKQNKTKISRFNYCNFAKIIQHLGQRWRWWFNCWYSTANN